MMKMISAIVLGLGLCALLAFTSGGAGDATPTTRTLGGEPVTLAQSSPKAVAAPAVSLTEKNDGQTISVKVGDEVEIKLESNITTGYGWRVVSVSSTSAKQSGKIEYVTPQRLPGSRIIYGAGGHNVLKFDGVSAGKVTINLEYVRPWEKNTKPARTFTVTLDVK